MRLQVEFHPFPHRNWMTLQGESEYLYHATSMDNLQDIAAKGMVVHRPDFGTDQLVWPDGATEKRSYWTDKPSVAYSFAPDSGVPVLLRVKRLKYKFKKESGTGDFYTTQKVAATELAAIDVNGNWVPIK